MNKFRAKRLTFKLKVLLKYELVRKNKRSGMNTFIGTAGNNTLLGGIGDDVLLGYEEDHLNKPDKSRATLEAQYAPSIGLLFWHWLSRMHPGARLSHAELRTNHHIQSRPD